MKTKKKKTTKKKPQTAAQKKKLTRDMMNRAIMKNKAEAARALTLDVPYNPMKAGTPSDEEVILQELLDNQRAIYLTALSNQKASLPWYSVIQKIKLTRRIEFVKTVTDNKIYLPYLLSLNNLKNKVSING